MRPGSVAVLVAVTVLALAGCVAQPSTLVVPTKARAYFFGDSWTNGYSADPGHGFPEVVTATLGWSLVRSPDGSGSGFVHVYPGAAGGHPYPVRARALPAHIRADVIVLEGGINDVGFDLRGYEEAVDSTLTTLRRKVGNVPVVLVGPPATVFPSDPSLAKVDALLSAAAKRDGAFYVSPYREQWITRANVGLIIDPKTGHPSTAGHAYIGGRLAADIERLER